MDLFVTSSFRFGRGNNRSWGKNFISQTAHWNASLCLKQQRVIVTVTAICCLTYRSDRKGRCHRIRRLGCSRGLFGMWTSPRDAYGWGRAPRPASVITAATVSFHSAVTQQNYKCADSRNLPLMPQGLLNLLSILDVFQPSANPDDSTLHTGLQWEKLWVRQAGASGKTSLTARAHSSILLLSDLTLFPQWILHHHCHSDLCSSPDPSVTQLPLTRGGKNRTGRYGLNYQTHPEEATFSGRFGGESAWGLQGSECDKLNSQWLDQAAEEAKIMRIIHLEGFCIRFVLQKELSTRIVCLYVIDRQLWE